jgi:uncharacterized membrane protein
MNILFLILGISNFALLVYLWWFSVKNHKNLPGKIPIHFGFDGKPDGFGNKKWFWLIPIIGTVFFISFLGLNFFQESANYVVEITEANKGFQYGLGGVFMQVLVLVILCMFFVIQDYTVKLTKDDYAKTIFPMWIFVVLLFFSTMTFIIISATDK